MDTLNVSPVFLFFLVISIASSIDDDCPNSICSDRGPVIRFPFQLQSNQSDEHCGYPGFELSCNEQRKAVLELPYSGDFLVREIDYAAQDIQIYDPYNCLPRRLLHLNLSGSPFKVFLHQNYTFLSCPSEFTMSRFKRIACLSNSTHSVLAISSMNLVEIMSRACDVMRSVLIPVSWPLQVGKKLSSDLSDDLRLTWDAPDCSGCEARRGRCRFKNNTSQEIVCFDVPPPRAGAPGKSHDGLKTFKIISLATGIPAMMCGFGVVCYICLMDRNGGGSAQRPPSNMARAVVPLQPTAVSGLDESTIESYNKIVLGESRRLPAQNDWTCSICLSEYRPKETLRCIPECKHCFHVECIDEWLRMNATCPVCRKSPSPANPTLPQP